MGNVASVRFVIAVNKLIFRFNVDKLFLLKFFFGLKIFIIIGGLFISMGR